MIKINKLKKYYGNVKAVDGIDLTIKKGEIYGFIGPNGAGKSTTIRCIMDLINKNSGDILINDIEVNRKNYLIKDNIGYLPGEIYLYDDYTVKEMINYSKSFYKTNCDQKIKSLVKRLKLDLNKKIDELSLGNLKKLGIVLTLMHDPQFIILDEATSGLDPLMQEELYKILLEEKENNKTIFFSTHNLSEIKKISDTTCIIKDGKIIDILNVNSLMNNHLIVTITTNDLNKLKEDNKFDIISINNNTIKILYQDEINKLLKLLNKYKIDKLLIEEASISDIFMRYYE